METLQYMTPESVCNLCVSVTHLNNISPHFSGAFIFYLLVRAFPRSSLRAAILES